MNPNAEFIADNLDSITAMLLLGITLFAIVLAARPGGRL